MAKFLTSDSDGNVWVGTNRGISRLKKIDNNHYKVNTINLQGNTITPYIQIFYEDNNGGVIRIKPYGNTDAPPNLTHLRKAHGTLYFKNDPNGDLSWENEAFKVYGNQPLPKSPKEVKLPDGIVYGSQQAEDFLAQCWTYYTHVSVDSIFD
jgi:hypothetical protein